MSQGKGVHGCASACPRNWIHTKYGRLWIIIQQRGYTRQCIALFEARVTLFWTDNLAVRTACCSTDQMLDMLMSFSMSVYLQEALVHVLRVGGVGDGLVVIGAPGASCSCFRHILAPRDEAPSAASHLARVKHPCATHSSHSVRVY